ncbi:MAG: LCP family protein [Clostridiales bacterium]|jgi:LCP family protein required for cell wall assembly|nr:LCP family protein [Clostridiales bacterium]
MAKQVQEVRYNVYGHNPANRPQPNQNRPVKRKRSAFRLFLKTFFITAIVLSCFIFAGYIFLRNWIKPPQIAVLTPSVTDAPQSEAFENPGASVIIDGEHDENAYAPRGFDTSERKDLFFTFMVVGIDNNTQTDTIMVASYDGKNKKANIISIPRDGLVNVSRRIKKINGAYGAGSLNGGREGGLNQLKSEIKSIIGFAPDFYILINIETFVKIIDAVGGIEVNIPYDLNYDDPTDGLHIHIKKGFQTLYGEDAVKFARYRKINGGGAITDYERIEHQQTVMKAVADKVLRPESLLKIPEFIKIFSENVFTDIRTENLLWFASQVKGVTNTDALATYTMPMAGTSGGTVSYEFFDEDAIVELVNDTVNPYLDNIAARDLDIINYVP